MISVFISAYIHRRILKVYPFEVLPLGPSIGYTDFFFGFFDVCVITLDKYLFGGGYQFKEFPCSHIVCLKVCLCKDYSIFLNINVFLPYIKYGTEMSKSICKYVKEKNKVLYFVSAKL